MTATVPLDAEALVIAALAARMPTYTIGTRVQHRSGMVKVEQIGGSRTGHVHDFPMIVVQTWHDSDITAGDMCRAAFAHLWDLPNDPDQTPQVRSVESVGGPQSFPDPDSTCPRWQLVVRLNVRPTPLT